MAMEEMAGGEVGSGGKHLDVESVVRTDGSLASSKPIADPVVYKLVRVEGDGTLVPATDDEVIEVEDLLEEDKVEQPLLEASGQNERFISSDDLSYRGGDDEDSEGLAQSESLDSGPKKRNARREVKEEERLRLLHGVSDDAPKFASSVAISSDHCEQLPVGDASFLPSSVVMATLPSFPTSSIENLKNHSEACVQPKIEKVVNGNFVSNGSEGTKSEVSSAKGDICLDNLSIRELQQTFRATFGRDTSVKDKLWLKRRIAMGLSNSCDVSATGFIIDKSLLFCDELNVVANDNKLDDAQLGDNVVKEESCKMPVALDSENEGRLAGPERKSTAAKNENYSSEDPQMEQRGAKRLRKPTKRYIEELSEADTKESNEKSSLTGKKSAHRYPSQKSRSTVVCSTGSAEVAAILTRQDSFGGSGVQVPYVSRLRRGRPRKNFMGLLKHQNGMSATLVKKARGTRSRRQDAEAYNRSWKPKALSAPVQQKAGVEASNNETALVPYLGRRQQGLEVTKLDPVKDLEEYPLTVPTAKGGTRRKHHRAWTLSEVMRLVEGVSRCGAGRWSEIKRLAFASCAYRTSVDLKDKWRNLLRASAQALTDRAFKSSRKHSSIPIPAQILVRVRELAATHTPPTSKQYVKLTGKNGKNVHNKPGIIT
ncbi:uncharacterized protein LOC116258800 isoform X2 [Nymphaea colorata]|uniref:uncharacterized protein LOC116258800 isoform X2 n=1 Tax=Nymphaea colorata TaxID=210225 RepID=UPI00129D53A7|nr:uncharacterized protein LOC116258800 isoform X2 [Nymphaea colorata]